MQILIEISEDAYNKLAQKSMLMSASAIDEAVDAVKNGRIINECEDTRYKAVLDGNTIKRAPLERRTKSELKAYIVGYNNSYKFFKKLLSKYSKAKAIHKMDIFVSDVNAVLDSEIRKGDNDADCD